MDAQIFGSLFMKIWELFSFPIVLPVIGSTSLLKMMVFLAVLSLVVDFVRRWME